jgi:hypothetical protein
MVDDFKLEVQLSSLCHLDRWQSLDDDETAALYNSKLTATADRLGPAKTVAYENEVK